jgi:CHAD domain-containing protein
VAFALKKNEPVPAGVRRVVGDRVDRALKALCNGRGGASDEAVHEVRKRFKEVRGTLRLVRDELGDKTFRRENRAFRDAGRPLSQVRDAKVLVDSLDKLIEDLDGRIDARKLAPLRRALVDRRRATRMQTLERDHAVSEIVKSLRAARGRVKEWPLERKGWKALAGGLRAAYGEGRRAMKSARKVPSDDALHEWRKRTKDLRYQLELLEALRPAAMGPMVKDAHRLTDLLGHDHDLCVFGEVVRAQKRGKKADVGLIATLIGERRAALQNEARAVGEKLYAGPTREFVDRLHGYWKSARRKSA